MYTLAAALSLEACSLYIASTTGKLICYSAFCVFYLGVLLKTTVNCYYFGATQGTFNRTCTTILHKSLQNRGFLYRRRFLLAMLVVAANLILMAVFLFRALRPGPQSLSSPILVVCAVNVLALLGHYMVCKVKETLDSREPGNRVRYQRVRRWLVTVRCLGSLLAIGLAGAAFMFYTARRQSRNLAPAESRDMNRPCDLLGFYDTHDIWHFLSAPALFLTFVLLLTVDDDTLLLARSDIRVF
jgi:hypothetical protein